MISVIATNREPTPGWIDMNCIYGPSGVSDLFYLFYVEIRKS